MHVILHSSLAFIAAGLGESGQELITPTIKTCKTENGIANLLKIIDLRFKTGALAACTRTSGERTNYQNCRLQDGAEVLLKIIGTKLLHESDKPLLHA